MHWDDDEVAALVRPWMEGSARELARPVETVRRMTVGDGLDPDRRERFRDRGYDHVPLRPYHHDECYHVERDEVVPIDAGQYVGHEETALHVLNVLTEHPFALVRHPDNDEWRIATAADLNGRGATAHLAPVFSEAADAVTDLLAARYDPEELLPVYLHATERRGADGAEDGDATLVRDRETGRDPAREWAHARSEGVDPHLAELFGLADLGAVVATLDAVCGDLDLGDGRVTRRTFESTAAYHRRLVRPDRLVVTDRAEVPGLAAAVEDADRIDRRARALLPE